MAKLTDAQRNALPGSAFVFPNSRKYPIHDKGHAMHAIRTGAIQLGKGNLTVPQYNQIVKAVNTRWGFNAKFKMSKPLSKKSMTCKGSKPMMLRKSK